MKTFLQATFDIVFMVQATKNPTLDLGNAFLSISVPIHMPHDALSQCKKWHVESVCREKGTLAGGRHRRAC